MALARLAYAYLVLLTCTVNWCVAKTENETFVATKEWQPIKEGQQVPAGLHYRINLETGIKEAKLLDEAPEEYLERGERTSSLSVVEPKNENQTRSNGDIPSASLEEALKNIPAEIYEYSRDEMEEIKSKFRTYDEMKDQLRDVNLNIRTDAEIVKKLILEYVEIISSNDVSRKLIELEHILDDLEYLVHQVDNALVFLDLGGLEKVVLVNLNRTDRPSLKTKSLTLIGSALQNNPKAQTMAYEKELAEHLIRFLSTTKLEPEINAGLFAFGSLVRRFPVAQKHVMSRSVINVLFELWAKEISLKIKVKVLTLFTDLLVEAEEAQKAADSDEDLASERALQYAAVHLEIALQESEYCRNVERFVVLEKPALISSPEQTERVIASLNYSTGLCKEKWSENPDLRHVILVLKNRYSDQVLEMGADGDSSAHLRDIIGEIERLHAVLFQYLQDKVKDEL